MNKQHIKQTLIKLAKEEAKDSYKEQLTDMAQGNIPNAFSDYLKSSLRGASTFALPGLAIGGGTGSILGGTLRETATGAGYGGMLSGIGGAIYGLLQESKRRKAMQDFALSTLMQQAPPQ